MFGGCAQVLHLKLRRLGARSLQQIGQDAVDLHCFFFGVFDDRAGRAVGRQVAADDFDDAGNSGQRIADFVRQAGRQFAQGCEVFGARHLGLVQALDFFPAGFQLRDHVVEVAAQVANFVVALGEADGDVHVAEA